MSATGSAGTPVFARSVSIKQPLWRFPRRVINLPFWSTLMLEFDARELAAQPAQVQVVDEIAGSGAVGSTTI
jgi:hypothetical protein